MGLSERPARTDPATGLSRPGQVESQNPAGAYRGPGANVTAPRPATGGGGPETSMGRPGGPGFSAGGGPGVPTDLPVVTPPRGVRESGMTGPLMRSGNAPADFSVSPTASAEESRADVISGVLETVRRNGGDPFDGR